MTFTPISTARCVPRMNDRKGFLCIMRKTVAAAALLAGLMTAAQAQTFDLINEYPATSLPGEADVFFAEAVNRATGGRVTIKPLPDAKSGLRTREQLKAVTDGRFAMADSFAGALGDENSIFLLSTLPFTTPSLADARALYDAARPLYEAIYAERKQKLLYVVPWPPSGIWSAAPVTSIDALRALKIRTYDNTGTDVFAKVTAAAAVVSFADLNPKLEAGEINAVLSSGDGGAGRQLWRFLRNFSEISYAIPLSFTSISLDAWASLDDAGRKAIEDAARATSERQWAVLASRMVENFVRMRANGVAIDEKPPAEVMSALRAAAAQSIEAWQAKASPDARQVLAAFLAQKR